MHVKPLVLNNDRLDMSVCTRYAITLHSIGQTYYFHRIK